MINYKLFLKGTAMGCADLIPGVSGGTIALITGIYEELINSIRSFDHRAFGLLFSLKLKSFWQHVNGSFLVHVFGGMLLSIFLLTRLITYLLSEHPIPLWSFFFGLILISAFYVMPKRVRVKEGVMILLGAALAYTITTLTPGSTPDALWFVFIAGSIAICAMILPGISGSFILILLAKYEFILGALKAFDIKVIIVFGLGCVIGLLSFSKLIHWLLQHQRSVTMATLAGFMLGSLNKIWPWKTSSDITVRNLTPSAYEQLTNSESLLGLAILFFVIGSVLVVLLERLGQSSK